MDNLTVFQLFIIILQNVLRCVDRDYKILATSKEAVSS